MTEEDSLDVLLARIDEALTELDDESLPLEQAFGAYSAGLQALQSAQKVLVGYEERFQALQAQADEAMAELADNDEE